MKLQLSRPIVFFDLETTGVDPFTDRIVQIGAVKINTDGSKEEYNKIINPQQPIPPGAAAVHGISDDMVKDAPTLGDLAQELTALFTDVDLGGYNIKNFDIPLLQTEFNRIGLTLDTEDVKIVDAMTIFRMKEPRTLTAAYQKYCGKELVDAHDALADIRASVDVLEGQLATYDDIPPDVAGIHEFCFPKNPDAYDAEGKLIFVDKMLTINFGKNKGKTLQQLSMEDPGYLEWILGGSFSEKVKEAIRSVMK